MEKMVIVKREDLVYQTNAYVHNFQQYETLRSFIFEGKITFPKDESDLWNDFLNFKKETKSTHNTQKKLKRYYWKHRCLLWRYRNAS